MNYSKQITSHKMACIIFLYAGGSENVVEQKRLVALSRFLSNTLQLLNKNRTRYIFLKEFKLPYI